MAIAHANSILDWEANLPSDEMPPPWMWHLDAEIEEWFIEVKRARDEKYGTGSEDTPETVPMTGNDLADERRRA